MIKEHSSSTWKHMMKAYYWLQWCIQILDTLENAIPIFCEILARSFLFGFQLGNVFKNYLNALESYIGNFKSHIFEFQYRAFFTRRPVEVWTLPSMTLTFYKINPSRSLWTLPSSFVKIDKMHCSTLQPTFYFLCKQMANQLMTEWDPITICFYAR